MDIMCSALPYHPGCWDPTIVYHLFKLAGILAVTGGALCWAMGVALRKASTPVNLDQ